MTPAPDYSREGLLDAVKGLAPALRAASAEIERGRSLTEPIVQAMVDAGLYRMFLPRALGGGEIDPLVYLDVVEALAQVESAAAWSVLISTSSMTMTVRALADEPRPSKKPHLSEPSSRPTRRRPSGCSRLRRLSGWPSGSPPSSRYSKQSRRRQR
ncbi:MAG: hypothetical protein FJZ38_25645 [Candidatus Rokubacteria bacterium]|nr:hypothetical protein [Candidatus Rokubacteria bacterium]